MLFLDHSEIQEHQISHLPTAFYISNGLHCEPEAIYIVIFPSSYIYCCLIQCERELQGECDHLFLSIILDTNLQYYQFISIKKD